MPIEDFTFYNGKVKICSFLSYSTDGKIEEIVEKLKKSESWEKLHRKMGLTASEEDTQFSHWLVTGDKKINSKLINGDKTIQALEQAAKKCLSEIGEDSIEIGILPSYDSFIWEKLKGSWGCCTEKGKIILQISPLLKDLTFVTNTFLHELAHALSSFYNMGNLSIGEGIIFDGLAENFREAKVGGEQAPWVQGISEAEAYTLLAQIKPLLSVRDGKVYSEIFFGTGKYPLWAGYAIGYYLIKNYLAHKGNVDWGILLRTNPDTFLTEILNE